MYTEFSKNEATTQVNVRLYIAWFGASLRIVHLLKNLNASIYTSEEI